MAIEQLAKKLRIGPVILDPARAKGLPIASQLQGINRIEFEQS